MSRRSNTPSAENCTLAELDTAAQAAVSRRSHIRMMAMKALIMGVGRQIVAGIFGVSERTLTRWVDRFNCSGIDGLLEGRHTGRFRKITPGQSAEYEELIRFPERANQTHWTGKKFHGYLIKELEQKIGYRTVVRWLHDQGFRLKVPRPWPNGQDEEKRKAFVEGLKVYLADPELDIWYLDETGIEGDPRPRRRWAKKGEKIRQPYQGAHIRMSATGMVCPRTGEFYSLVFTHSDTEVFKLFLDEANADIQFQRPRNLLILDNAAWHKRKSINWGKFQPLFLPPYSPDLNPIEALWLVMKGEWFSGFIAKNRDQLVDRLCQALNWIIDRKDQNQKTCAIRTEI
jgi:transposase